MIYIIGHEKYLDYYGNSLLKYPLKIYRPNFRARRIARILNSQKEVGSIVGVNLRAIDYREEKSLNAFIKNLKTIQIEEETLYMEEGAEIPLASLERIERETGLILARGLESKIQGIPTVMDEIERLRLESGREKEVLIIGKEEDLLKKTIDLIGRNYSFISLLALDQTMESLYENIFQAKGISLYEARIDKINLNSYDLIINFWDNYPLKEENLKESTIIFDYSWERPFKKLKNNMVITDFNFQLKDDKLGLDPLIGSKLNSSLYELISGDGNGKIHQLEINGRYYNLSFYLKGRLKGRKGHF